MQAVTEKSLSETIQNAKAIDERAKDAEAGAIVAINVKTGEILAMASYPDFSPGDWIRRNRAKQMGLLQVRR